MPYFRLSDGVPLYYSDQGSGRPLVLMHALMFDADYFWQKNIHQLAQDCRVIAVDLRGQGLSGKANHGYTIPQFAKDLEELLAHLGLENVVLAGLSLGGMVAIEYLRQFGADRVGRLVVMEMTPRLPSAEGWEHPTFGEFPEEAAKGYGDALRADRAVYDDFFQAAFLEPPSGDALDEMVAHTYLTPTEVAAEVIGRMAEHDIRDQIAHISVPTTFFYGYPNNRILPTPIGQWMQSQVPGSDLVLFENSSHSMFWEEPAKFNDELLKVVKA